MERVDDIYVKGTDEHEIVLVNITIREASIKMLIKMNIR